MDARQRWTLILTSVASLMVGLDLTVVTTALNTIRLDLGASIAELDWTINAYTLTIGVLLLTAAAAGDRLGRRRRQQKHADGECVRVDGPVELGDRGAEVQPDGVECGGHDREVESHHEGRNRGKDEGPALSRVHVAASSSSGHW